ncbi:MAG: bifunctional diaminohydroxyphosphoribosylaminopyrimidine deaminase/5-amino-6-(5-phosphoribosylamino)uracil reductase RibD [Actinomycetota bacterium]|nr:bifunctional diaminohydroxyphosphoribosylaminopyrimidine deaminase/5-amino-6-(5-phosphoribosylamino)uracil reductase RibD [Actinomycetota bacterium]
MASSAEVAAMSRALELAQSPDVPRGPNPRVGCVLLDAEGRTIAEGIHRGAGTAHAEVDALRRAGDRARGATAVVTLEPCTHTGRTGPCAQALIERGVTRVVFAQADPNPVAAGGARMLAEAGVDVASGVLADEARAVNRAWSFAVEKGRPHVTWKLATTLDGRSAAADGSSRWITSPAARADVHRLRASCDVVLVGTGTVLADDPELTVRDGNGRSLPQQPLRAVMGRRSLSRSLRVFDDAAETVVLAVRDPVEALRELFRRDRQHVLLEGGPTLAAAFLRLGLVDEIVAFLAPALLGAGAPAVGDLAITTIADIVRFDVRDVTRIGTGRDTCIRITMEV